MSNIQLKYNVTNVISFGRFYNLITPVECIVFHQWAQLGVVPAKKFKEKFTSLKKQIEKEQWERPEYFYDTQLKLTFRTKNMETFKPVPNENY